MTPQEADRIRGCLVALYVDRQLSEPAVTELNNLVTEMALGVPPGGGRTIERAASLGEDECPVRGDHMSRSTQDQCPACSTTPAPAPVPSVEEALLDPELSEGEG